MKTLRSLHTVLGLLSLGAVLLGTTAVHASIATYLVDIDTSALNSGAATASAPFSLDLQLNGDGLGIANSAMVRNVTFFGGNAVAGTVGTNNSSILGDLASTVSMTTNATNPFNDFFQQWAGNVSKIEFYVDLTTNNSGLSPDGFSVAVLDSSLGNIPTNDPGLSDALLKIAINNGTAVSTFSSTGATGGVTVTAIPEPSAYAGILGACALAAGLYRRVRRTNA